MTDQWDRFADSAGRTLDALGFDSNVEVYQPTEEYTPGDGYETTYPDAPTTTLDGALDPPSSSPDIDPGGTTETADLVVYVRADVGIQFNDAGDTGEAKTGLEVDGLQYVVDDIDDQQDGFLALGCDEVDQWP
jgi:hypothetical protein